jgi:hypothetical protein
MIDWYRQTVRRRDEYVGRWLCLGYIISRHHDRFCANLQGPEQFLGLFPAACRCDCPRHTNSGKVLPDQRSSLVDTAYLLMFGANVFNLGADNRGEKALRSALFGAASIPLSASWKPSATGKDPARMLR